jgi:hypothetical protein
MRWHAGKRGNGSIEGSFSEFSTSCTSKQWRFGAIRPCNVLNSEYKVLNSERLTCSTRKGDVLNPEKRRAQVGKRPCSTR